MNKPVKQDGSKGPLRALLVYAMSMPCPFIALVKADPFHLTAVPFLIFVHFRDLFIETGFV